MKYDIVDTIIAPDQCLILLSKTGGCKKLCVNGIGLLPRHPVFKLNAKAV